MPSAWYWSSLSFLLPKSTGDLAGRMLWGKGALGRLRSAISVCLPDGDSGQYCPWMGTRWGTRTSALLEAENPLLGAPVGASNSLSFRVWGILWQEVYCLPPFFLKRLSISGPLCEQLSMPGSSCCPAQSPFHVKCPVSPESSLCRSILPVCHQGASVQLLSPCARSSLHHLCITGHASFLLLCARSLPPRNSSSLALLLILQRLGASLNSRAWGWLHRLWRQIDRILLFTIHVTLAWC